MRARAGVVRGLWIITAAVITAAAGLAAARPGFPPPPPVRPGRQVSLDALKEQAGFTPLAPADMVQGFTLDRIEVVSVDRAHGQAVAPPWPAVRFSYQRAQGPGTIDLLETPRGDLMGMVDIVLSSYFADWSKQDLRTSTRGDVQYALLGGSPVNLATLEELERVPWVAAWEVPAAGRQTLPLLPDPVVGDVGTEDVGARWPGKRILLTDLLGRCSFTPLQPRWLPAGYSLHGAELVWVAEGLNLAPEMPAQHGVRLVYARPGDTRAINVIETRRSPTPDNWAAVLVGQGYFADFERDPRITFTVGSSGGVDFAVIAKAELDWDRVRNPREWRPFARAVTASRSRAAR